MLSAETRAADALQAGMNFAETTFSEAARSIGVQGARNLQSAEDMEFTQLLQLTTEGRDGRREIKCARHPLVAE